MWNIQPAEEDDYADYEIESVTFLSAYYKSSEYAHCSYKSMRIVLTRVYACSKQNAVMDVF